MRLNLTQMADSLIIDIVPFGFVATNFELQTVNGVQCNGYPVAHRSHSNTIRILALIWPLSIR